MSDVVIEERAWEFLITLPREFNHLGFVATLPKCGRDDCAEGKVTPCVKPSNHARADNEANREHNRTHCHDWHAENVQRFVERVRAAGKPTKPRVPTRRPAPVMQPGSRIEWVERPRPGEEITRVGVVWSDSPRPRTVWVQPDDDPTNQVLVEIPTGKRYLRTVPELVPGYPATWQRDTIRRCDNLMRAGHVFGVVDQERQLTYGGKLHPVISWHADPECPGVYRSVVAHNQDAPVYAPMTELVRKKPYVDHRGNPGTVPATVVVGKWLDNPVPGAWCPPEFCRRCVWLDERAEIGAMA